MEIKNYQKGDEKKIISLFELVFKRPMSLEQWQWRFENNPAGKYMIKLMWDGDVLAGHYAVSPIKMMVGEREILTTLSLTTMTNPDYGRRGIFGDLANALYNQLEQELGVGAIWGFPNNNSHYGFIKNLNWKDVAVIHTLTASTKNMTAANSDSVQLVTSFDDSHVQLLAETNKDFPVRISRYLEYLDWRYLKKPSTVYYIMEYNHDGIKDFVVYKLYKSSDSPETWEVFFMEIAVKDSASLKIIMEHILDYYKDKNIASFNLWMSMWHKQHIQFEKLGFNPGGKQTYLGIRADEQKLPEVFDFRKWYYTMGDSDVY